MITCDNVDLPDPFGPMSACTSPDATSRSTPRRISFPSTAACRSSIRNTLMLARSRRLRRRAARAPLAARRDTRLADARSWDAHDHVVAFDAHRVHGDRLGGRKALGLAADQRKGRPMLRALDLELVVPEVAFAQRVV